MRSNPTCQHTPTRGYQGTVLIHGSLGTGAFSNSPALYWSLTSPRTLSGPPPPVGHMVLGTPSPYPCHSVWKPCCRSRLCTAVRLQRMSNWDVTPWRRLGWQLRRYSHRATTSSTARRRSFGTFQSTVRNPPCVTVASWGTKCPMLVWFPSCTTSSGYRTATIALYVNMETRELFGSMMPQRCAPLSPAASTVVVHSGTPNSSGAVAINSVASAPATRLLRTSSTWSTCSVKSRNRDVGNRYAGRPDLHGPWCGSSPSCSKVYKSESWSWLASGHNWAISVGVVLAGNSPLVYQAHGGPKGAGSVSVYCRPQLGLSIALQGFADGLRYILWA